MSSVAAPTDKTKESSGSAKDKARRTYRACVPCKSRKLKCDFGDPDSPSLETCRRCLRERRECVKTAPNPISGLPPPPSLSTLPAALPTQPPAFRPSAIPSGLSPPAPSLPPAAAPPSKRRRTRSPSQPRSHDPQGTPASDSEEGEDDDDDPLVSSSLENPRDALRLLATASCLNYQECDVQPAPSPSEVDPRSQPPGTSSGGAISYALWERFEPCQLGIVTAREAEALFTFFETELAHLYPILPAALFSSQHFCKFVDEESLLLGATLAIASRYSLLLINGRDRTVHLGLSAWIRRQIQYLQDGEQSLRIIGSVEALLLLSEWPLLPLASFNSSAERGDDFLKPSLRYDSLCWSQIGMAVRLAQELGLQNSVTYTVNQGSPPQTWEQERVLRTWIFAYNADRHISVRLGRNSVFQAYLSSSWWEKVSDLSSRKVREKGGEEAWVDDVFAPSLLACLMGTVQDRLYGDKEVTRVLLRTGVWESFLKTFRLELQFIRRCCSKKLKDGKIDSALLEIELNYASLYGNAIALSALQKKLQRRIKADDLYYRNPSLLNLIEGPYILEALSAARSIVQTTVHFLSNRDLLRNCPSRIFQRVLFAATFLYEALAVGVIEHGKRLIIDLLDLVIKALWKASLDENHFVRVYAVLLQRLQDQWTSLSSPLRSRAPTARQSPQSRPADVPSQPAASTSASPMYANVAGPSTSALPSTNPLPSTSMELPQGDGAPPIFDPPSNDYGEIHNFMADTFNWRILQTPDAGRAQDLLLSNLWTVDDSSAPFNLYQTLLGDNDLNVN